MSEELRKDYLVELPKKIKKEIEKVSKELKLNKKQRKKLEEEVKKEYLQGLFEPGEAIGIIAAQSISEPATQMCINGEEKILLKSDGVIQIKKIKDFVDWVFKKYCFKKIGNYEVCDLPESENIFALGLDQNEKLKWGKITSCVRLIANKKLIMIKTKSGRKIVATDSHSFVTRKNNRIVAIRGSDLKIGNRIPVIKFLPMSCISFVNFTSTHKLNNLTQPVKSKLISRKIYLNSSFGWLVGTYLSKKEKSGSQIKTNRTFVEMSETNKIHPNTSSIISSFIVSCCGIGSDKKVPEFAYSAPKEFVSALLRGYFDGSGSVSISRKIIKIYSNSEKLIDGIKLLLARFKIFAYKRKQKKQFNLIIPLKYAPIFLKKVGSDIEKKRKKLEKLSELAEKFLNRSRDFDVVGGFGDILYKIAKKLKYPTSYVNTFTKKQKIGKITLCHYTKLFEKLAKKKNVDISKELKILKRILNSDVIWDEISEISYVNPSSKYVYDISVKGLKTFTTFDGVITHNTMRTYHFAGAAGIKVTYGLPRLIEIFDARRKPKTPMMTIFLKRKFNNAESAKKLAEEIVEKKVLDVVKSISINLTAGSVELELKDKRGIKKTARKLKDVLKGFSVKIKRDRISISPKKVVEIKELQKLKEKVLDITVSGIKGISNAVIRKERDDWIISTIGSNLEAVLLLDKVDKRRTYSNDLHEVAKVLGIEAARNLIIKEAVNTLQQQGLDVDIRHIMLVADIMTFRGNVRAIGRYGVAGTKTSVLARAAFEETIKHLVRASIRKEADNFAGIFENVMIGKVVPSGTGMFELIAKLEKE